ncbi:hypothetical protein [Nocardia iowensis]|uniref:hypothetical protein n=1 Tax=Nocardia iowensis TaxID=204891 RepID=UPI0031E7B655
MAEIAAVVPSTLPGLTGSTGVVPACLPLALILVPRQSGRLTSVFGARSISTVG